MTIALEAKGVVIAGINQPIDFTACLGECIIIVSANERHRNRLCQHLAGIKDIQAGNLTLWQQSPNTLDAKAWLAQRPNIAYLIKQHSLVSHLTVLQNLILPLSYHGTEQQQADSLARSMLNRLGITINDSDLPSTLSVEQQRIVALGRALMSQPKLLFAENAFAELSAEFKSRFVDIYASLLTQGDSCIVLSTEDLLSVYKLVLASPTRTKLIYCNQNSWQLFASWEAFCASANHEIQTMLQDCQMPLTSKTETVAN